MGAATTGAAGGITGAGGGGGGGATAGDFIRAGVVAIGIREELIPAEAIAGRDLDWIRELTRRFQAIVKRARSAMSKH